MFALDLFNTQYERELREGAVDNLEARRIDDLNAKMQDLLARAKHASPEMKAGLKREFDKVKDERDSYFKVRNETMGYGTLVGETDTPVQRPSGSPWAHVKGGAPNKGIGDLQDPKQKMAQLKQKAKTGPLANVGAGLKAFFKGEPEPMDEQNYAPTKATGRQAVGRTAQAAQAPRAFGVGNFQRLVKANMSNRPYVDLEFANSSDNLKLDQAGLDLISDYYDGLESDQAKNHFIYRVLPSADEVKTLLTKLGWNSTGQQQLPLAEKKKFNSNSDLEAGDVKVARELQKLRALYPAAKSDVEAVAKAELDGTERSQQQLAAIKGANEKQDVLLKQLVSLDQEQGRELDDLDQENNTLEKRLARVQATNDRLQQTVSQIAGTKKVDSKSDQTKADTPNKTNQDNDEEDVEPAIDIIPNAPVDNTPTPATKSKAQPKKVYTKRKEKTSPGLGHMAQQIAGLPKVAPDDTKTDTGISEPEKADNSAPENDMVQRPGSLKALRPKVATNADDFKLVAEQQNKLSVGDPITVTAPNEFEGSTGEIYDFSPSGTFVIVNLYNHGKHSMHLSDVEYNQYADKQEEDDWYDDADEFGMPGSEFFPEGYATAIGLNPPALDPVKHWKNQVRQLIADYIKNPQGLYTLAKQKGSNSAEAMAYRYLMHPKGKIDLPPDAVTFEGFVPLDKYSPTAVCIAGKPVKKFDYYKDAENFYKNWKQKLYREGNKEKADKITLMPLNLDEEEQKPLGFGEFPPKQEITIIPPKKLKSGQTYQDQNKYWQSQGQAPIYKTNEAGNPAQQAAIAIAMKKAGKKPKSVDEGVGKQLSVEQLATISDAALDSAYGYGRSQPGNTFGWQANLKSAAFAKQMIDRGVTDIEQISNAIHKGWNVTAQAFVKNPMVFDDSKTMAPEKLQAKIAQRQKLMTQNYAQLPEDEKEKDRVVARAMLQAITGQQQSKFDQYQQQRNTPAKNSAEYINRQANAKPGDPVPPPFQKGVTEDTGSWIVYDPETKQIKKRFKTHTAGKSYAKTHGLGFASSEFYFDRVKDNKEVTEGVMSNVHAAMADVYHRLAPKIERHRDNFLAGQLYDELENIAELHGIEPEFKRMMAGARNRAHMDYDTNPGGFQNWFWYLPFEEEDLEEGSDLINMSDLQFYKELLGVMIIPVAAFGAMAWHKAMNAIKLYRAEDVITALQKKGVTVDRSTLEQIKPLLLKLEQAIDVNKDGDTAKELAKRIQQTVTWGKLKQANPDTTVNRKSEVVEEQDTSGVERAILNRVMVAHTDLLMKFGPEKVMQAAEEVAYNAGDVDEIGTSDVSAYVAQVKQILGVPAELDEKWSQKYKSSINCANPKGFSQRAHCAGKKK